MRVLFRPKRLGDLRLGARARPFARTFPHVGSVGMKPELK